MCSTGTCPLRATAANDSQRRNFPENASSTAVISNEPDDLNTAVDLPRATFQHISPDERILPVIYAGLIGIPIVIALFVVLLARWRKRRRARI